MRQPSPSDLVSTLNAMREEAEAAKSPVHSNWDICWEQYNGDQWRKSRFVPPWTANERVTVNLVKSTVATILPIVADSVPTWYVKAYDPKHDDSAELLTRFLQALWFDERLDRAYHLACKSALVTGTGAMKVYLNQMDQRAPLPTTAGRGRVDVAYIDPYCLFPDPNAQNLEDCRYLGIKTAMPESLIKRLYPDANMKALEAEIEGERRGEWYKDTQNTGEERRYDVWEFYHDFGDRLSIYSGSEVLFDGPSPVPNGRFPVVLFLDDERGTDMWGCSLVDNGGADLQRAVNKVVWRIMCHARICVNPRLVKEGLGKVGKIRNVPGEIIVLNSPNARLRPLEVPPLPPYVFSLLELFLRLWDVMTGVHDVTQGVRPVGVQSGAAILRLQEAAQTRIRQMIRMWSLQLGEVGQLVLDFMQRYYRGTRSVFRVSGTEVERITIDESTLRTPEWEPIPYRVVVQPQSDLPMSQTAWAELIMQLAALPWPDPLLKKMVFNALRVPGREKYFEELEQAAIADVQQKRRMELEAGLHGVEDMRLAGSPSPVGQDSSDFDFSAALAAMAGTGQTPPGAEPTGEE